MVSGDKQDSSLNLWLRRGTAERTGESTKKQKMERRFVAQAAREPVRASQIWEQDWLVSRHSGYGANENASKDATLLQWLEYTRAVQCLARRTKADCRVWYRVPHSLYMKWHEHASGHRCGFTDHYQPRWHVSHCGRPIGLRLSCDASLPTPLIA